jgi:hypothetical protein
LKKSSDFGLDPKEMKSKKKIVAKQKFKVANLSDKDSEEDFDKRSLPEEEPDYNNHLSRSL